MISWDQWKLLIVRIRALRALSLKSPVPSKIFNFEKYCTGLKFIPHWKDPLKTPLMLRIQLIVLVPLNSRIFERRKTWLLIDCRWGSFFCLRNRPIFMDFRNFGIWFVDEGISWKSRGMENCLECSLSFWSFWISSALFLNEHSAVLTS